ncbi:hypothetical protein [Clostridium sp. HBUAS56017]|uniref:hypothetical protein n=1 Tax=Clostridium sp. HBUAS56017 TaxID=2571128 RepID=UPI00117892ED|nr:hypothetical protein [Clostridium sp. HBUAS56017]
MKILDFFKGKERVDKLIEELQNPNEEKREEALKAISEMELTLTEGIKLLEACKGEFPKSKYEWKDISSDLIAICAARPYGEYILKIENIYKDLNDNAKIAALNFLASYDNEKALISYVKLLEKDYQKLMSLPVGNLNGNPRGIDILFPRILKFADNKDIAVDIYMILLTCFNNGLIREEKIESSKAVIVQDIVDMAHRIINYKFNEDDKSLWDNDDYLDLRYSAGVYFDLGGYINDPEVILSLRGLMKIKDMRLKMFAGVSLIKLGENLSEEDALEIAGDNETRNWFYINLKGLDKLEVYPEKYNTQSFFAESNMVDWLVYPTELGRVPDEIELMNVFTDGDDEYYLFRFRCENEEDPEESKWMAGLSGPFNTSEGATTSAGGYTFSRFDKWEDKTPEEHMKSIVGNIGEFWKKRAEELE